MKLFLVNNFLAVLCLQKGVSDYMEYIKQKDIASELGVTRQTISNWAKNGILVPDIKLPNGTKKYSRETIDTFKTKYFKQKEVD